MGLIVSAFFLFLWGPYFGTYLIYRHALLALARDWLREKPAALFAASLVMGYIWSVGTSAAIFLSVFIADKLHETGIWGLLALFGIMSMIVGPFGWLILFLLRFSRLRKYKLYRRTHPAPKFQLWLQDILVGAFSLGLAMTILLNFKHRIHNPAANVGLVIYEILTQFVMFFAALDAMRFSKRLTAPRGRALYLFLLMLVNAFLPLPLLTALSWNVWRRAMFLAEVEPSKGRVLRGAA